MVIIVIAHNFFLETNTGIFHYYMDDLFAIPVIGTIILYIQKRIDNNYQTLPVSHIITICIAVIILFELVLPHFSKLYTRDLFDIVAYVIGAVFFYVEMNR